jgi:hypothetical protein
MNEEPNTLYEPATGTGGFLVQGMYYTPAEILALIEENSREDEKD